MTMISGKIGITSSTSVTSDSAPSAIPPRYAAETPMSTANAVARPPTPNAMMIDWRVPQISCERTSWPYAVVPNQWWLDDPSPGRKSVACGSCGAICPGKIASTRKNTSRITPASALRLRPTARQRSAPYPRRASASGGSGPGVAVGSAAVIAVMSGPACAGRVWRSRRRRQGSRRAPRPSAAGTAPASARSPGSPPTAGTSSRRRGS